MSRVVVIGGALPGIAAALRLSRAGHAVTLVERRDRIGGRLAEPGVWAPVLEFPAPLKDLLRKSGRAFDAELARRGLRLTEAPDAVHVFADGTRLEWPTDRGRQWRLLADRYDRATADRWRDTLDALDDTWQRLRPLGLEDELVAARQVRAAGRLGPRTIEDAAQAIRHPHLAELIRDTAWRAGSHPRRTPGWLASRLSVERTFGRWQLVAAEGRPLPAASIFELLADRLATRGVQLLQATASGIGTDGVRTDAGFLAADAVVSTVDPWTHLALQGRSAPRLAAAGLRPARAPRVTVRTVPDLGDAPAEEISHTPDGPVVTYRRPLPAGAEVVVHDHPAGTPTPGAGVAWAPGGGWLRRPAVRTRAGRLYVASASGRGGNEPWAQLLTAALATYAAHEDLTGADIRPRNRAYRP